MQTEFFSRPKPPSARTSLELVWLAFLFLFAVGLRLPHLQTIPALTDEFKEVGWALDLHDTHHIPLVAFDSYDGPLFTYLLALLFTLFGVSVALPRLFVLLVGALTVVVTYYFGKTLARGDWRVGALAALLLATNAHHILFNSHVAWSNDTTPFFTTLTMLAYLVATRQNHPLWLVGTGALFGLALQTHPSALFVAPALGIDFLIRRPSRALLRHPAPYLAVLAALVAYAPVLVYNIQNPLGSLRSASTATYAFENAPSLSKAFENIAPQFAAVARVALGSFGPADMQAFLTDPRLLLFLLVSLATLIWNARSGEPFPLITFLTAMFLLVVFNRFSAIPDSSRYFQFLLPVIYATWGWSALRLWKSISARGRIWNRASGVALGALFLAVGLSSLSGLATNYANMTASGRNNSAVLQMIELTRDPTAAPVLLDWQLANIRTGRGGDIADNISYLLRLDGRKPILVSTSTPKDLGGLQNLLRAQESAYLIGFPDTPDTLGAEFPLHPLLAAHFPCPSCPVSNDFVLYRWQLP